MSRQVISGWQAIVLIVLSNVPTAVFFIPTLMVSLTNQDAWIAVIISIFLAAIFIFYPIADLGRRYPGKTVVEYSEEILGKYLGKLIGISLIYCYFQIQCWSIREFTIIATVMLPESTSLIFSIGISVIITYAVYNGLEVIARCGEFLFPIGIGILLFVVLASHTDSDITNLLPILEINPLRLLLGSLHSFDWLAGAVSFCMLSAFLKKGTNTFKISFVSLLISGGILVIFTIDNIAVFGASALKITSWPLYELARHSKFPVLERAELLVIVFWIAWIFMRGAIFSYATILSISQVFNLKDYKFLIIVENILAVAYSTYQYDSYVEIFYLYKVAVFFHILFQIGPPLILWIVAILKEKLGNNILKIIPQRGK